MNHAPRVVERLLVHRQARVAGGAKTIEHLPERRIERQGDDVRARHHHVLDPNLVKLENVLEDGALLRRELLDRALVERVLDIVARRGRRQAEQRAHALEQARMLFAR